MKYLQTYELFEASKSEVNSFIIDFGMLITMNFAHIKQYAKDSISEIELTKMQSELKKPIINGKNYSEIIMDINPLLNNPKMLSGIFTQIKSLLEFIEPRIEKFVKECERKTIWINKIKDFKERYKKIILEHS